MAAEIVHDHDVAGLQYRHELLLDISAEGLAVDRPVENTWCGEPIELKSGKYRKCSIHPVDTLYSDQITSRFQLVMSKFPSKEIREFYFR